MPNPGPDTSDPRPAPRPPTAVIATLAFAPALDALAHLTATRPLAAVASAIARWALVAAGACALRQPAHR